MEPMALRGALRPLGRVGKAELPSPQPPSSPHTNFQEYLQKPEAWGELGRAKWTHICALKYGWALTCLHSQRLSICLMLMSRTISDILIDILIKSAPDTGLGAVITSEKAGTLHQI